MWLNIYEACNIYVQFTVMKRHLQHCWQSRHVKTTSSSHCTPHSEQSGDFFKFHHASHVLLISLSCEHGLTTPFKHLISRNPNIIKTTEGDLKHGHDQTVLCSHWTLKGPRSMEGSSISSVWHVSDIIVIRSTGESACRKWSIKKMVMYESSFLYVFAVSPRIFGLFWQVLCGQLSPK